MVKFGRAQHLGDTRDPDHIGKGYGGALFVNEECLGMGALHPKKAITLWEDVNFISYELINGTKVLPAAARYKSRGVRAKIMSGPQAHITLGLRDDTGVGYLILGTSGSRVRGLVEPFANAAGVTCWDDLADEVTPIPVVVTNMSVADEIGKLGKLRDDGLISEKEFIEQKARLLS